MRLVVSSLVCAAFCVACRLWAWRVIHGWYCGENEVLLASIAPREPEDSSVTKPEIAARRTRSCESRNNARSSSIATARVVLLRHLACTQRVSE